MIEQKGPGSPQAACRQLSSSIYLQACAPALPPVWQACPGASSFPSHLPLFLLLFSLHWFFFLSLYMPAICTSGVFYSKTVCACVYVVAVSIWVCAWLWMLLALGSTCIPLRKWYHSVVYSFKDRTKRAWHKSFRSGLVFFFFPSSVFCVALCFITEWFNLCFLFLMFLYNRPSMNPALFSLVLWRDVLGQNNLHQPLLCYTG